MSPDELRALAEALRPMAAAPCFDGIDLDRAADFLLACADAKPVAWLHDGFVSTNHEAVQHDEMRNRQCGFKAKPVVALYAHPAPAVPQAEPDDDDALVLGEPDMLTPEDVRRLVPQAEPKREPLSEELKCCAAMRKGGRHGNPIND